MNPSITVYYEASEVIFEGQSWLECILFYNINLSNRKFIILKWSSCAIAPGNSTFYQCFIGTEEVGFNFLINVVSFSRCNLLWFLFFLFFFLKQICYLFVFFTFHMMPQTFFCRGKGLKMLPFPMKCFDWSSPNFKKGGKMPH